MFFKILQFFIVSTVAFLYIPTDETVIVIVFFILLTYIYNNYGNSIALFFDNSINKIKEEYISLINKKQLYLISLVKLYKLVYTLSSNIIIYLKLLERTIINLIRKENLNILIVYKNSIKKKLSNLINLEKNLIKDIQVNFLKNLYKKSFSLSTKLNSNLIENSLIKDNKLLFIQLKNLDELTLEFEISKKKESNKKVNNINLL